MVSIVPWQNGLQPLFYVISCYPLCSLRHWVGIVRYLVWFSVYMYIACKKRGNNKLLWKQWVDNNCIKIIVAFLLENEILFRGNLGYAHDMRIQCMHSIQNYSFASIRELHTINPHTYIEQYMHTWCIVYVLCILYMYIAMHCMLQMCMLKT